MDIASVFIRLKPTDEGFATAVHLALDLTTGMTLEAWVQPTALGSLWRCVILKEQPLRRVQTLLASL